MEENWVFTERDKIILKGYFQPEMLIVEVVDHWWWNTINKQLNCIGIPCQQVWMAHLGRLIKSIPMQKLFAKFGREAKVVST